MTFVDTLARRTSDEYDEPFMPVVCATAGMMSESGGGVLLPPLATGAAMVTEIGTEVVGVVLFATSRPLAPVPYVTMIAALFVPLCRALRVVVTVSVAPFAPIEPDAGVTLTHGLSAFAVNVVAGVLGGNVIVCVAPAGASMSIVAFAAGGRTSVVTVLEYGPRASLQLLIPR